MNLPSNQVLVQVMLVGLLTGGVYALLASGLTLVFGVMRVINIAHAAFVVLGAYIAYWLFVNHGVDPLLSMVLSVPLFFVLGYLTQQLVIARVPPEPGYTVLVTFALAIALSGVMGAMWETTFRSVRTGYTSEVLRFSVGELSIRLPVVRIVGAAGAVAVLGVLYLILKRSDLGRAIRATIQNSSAAQLVGVNVGRVRALSYGIGLATAGAGGAIFSLIWSFNANSYEEWISKLLAIIVLGGLGSLPGALVGGLLMGVLEALAAVTVTTYISPIVFYLVLFFVLVFRPQGLFGTRVREG